MSEIDVSKVVGYEFKPYRVSYNRRDLILYALGVGAKDLKFVYEGDQGFCALPTFPVVLDFKGTSSDIAPFGSRFAEIPGLSINPAMILHGEQSVEQLRPLPVEGEFVLKGKVLAVYDKGKGAVLVTENVLVDDKGTPYTRLTSSIFIRGAGGFGGDRGPSGAGNEPPKRAPDAVHAETTLDSQALLYRLSGDYNPLHADPGMASMVGFEKPILHGLCSFGFATRAVLAKFCNNDTSLFKSIAVRFSSPVFPGETLVTEMWKEGNKVLLQLRVKERNVIAISNAVVELKGTGQEAPTSPTNVQLKSAPVFEAMKVAIAKHPELVQKINAVYLFNITHGNQAVTYLLDLKNGKGGVTSPAPENARADCTLTISDEHYFDMSSGKLNPQNAFMQGKLKVKGNMMLAQKLGLIQQAASKL